MKRVINSYKKYHSNDLFSRVEFISSDIYDFSLKKFFIEKTCESTEDFIVSRKIKTFRVFGKFYVKIVLLEVINTWQDKSNSNF